MVKVILTSDDFGLSSVYNKMMLELIENNKLTSVSIMINKVTKFQHNQVQKLQELKKSHTLSLGLHFEFSSLDINEELDNQWRLFVEIFKFSPNYIDIHKGSSFNGNFDSIALFCNKKNIPFRQYSSTKVQVKSPDISITATRTTLAELEEIIKSISSNNIYEFIFHIGIFDPDCKSSFNKERELDIEKLNFVINNLRPDKTKLISYNDI